jgi:DNA-binding CsgD family transcriptional regulator
MGRLSEHEMRALALPEGLRSALFIAAFTFSCTTIYLHEFQSFTEDIFIAVVPNLVSVAALLLLAWWAYCRSSNIHIMLACLVVLVGIWAFLLVTPMPLPTFGFTGILNGVAGALKMLIAGALLTYLSPKNAKNEILLGFLFSALVIPAFHAVGVLDVSSIQVWTFIGFCLFSALYILFTQKSREPFPPVHSVSFNKGNSGLSGLTELLRQSPLLMLLLPIVFFFLCFGALEVFSIYRGFGYIASDIPMYSAFGIAAVLYLVNRLKVITAWINILIVIAWIIFISSLFAVLLVDDFSPLIFSAMSAATQIMHVPIWFSLSEHSTEHSVSPLFLFGVAMSILLISITVGRIGMLLLFTYVTTDVQITSKIAAGTLAAISLLAIFLFIFQTRHNNKDVNECNAQLTRQVFVINRRFRTWGEDIGVTAREFEVLQLYAQGRSVPFISSELSVSESTIKTHIRRSYVKLGVHNKQELLDIIESFKALDDN